MKINIKRFVTLVTVIIIISFSIIPAKQPVEETAVNYKAQPIKPKILTYSDLTPIVEPEIEWLEFEATAYCPCEKCCGAWAKNRPNGVVYTASGEVAEEGITIAADWSVLPKGTVVEIDGVGTRIVQDKGGAIKGNRIDIYFLSHQEALEYGRQTVRLREVGN